MIGLSYGNFQAATTTPFTFGNALEFDGVNDFVTIGSNSDYKFASGGSDIAHSMGIWLKMDNTAGFRAVTKYNNTSNERFYYCMTTGSSLFTVRFFSSSNRYIGRNTSSLAAYAGQWIFLGWSYDASKSTTGIKIYLGAGGTLSRADNADYTNGGYTGMNETNVAPLRLGVLNTSSPLYADGVQDEYSIWDRVLTEAEFAAVYNSGDGIDLESDSGDYAASSNLTDWWRMDESSGNVLPAKVGSNNGVLNNFNTATCWVAH